MDIKKLIEQIGKLIDEKLDQKLEPIKNQLDVFDSKLGSLDKKVVSLEETLDERIDKLEEKLFKKIDESQEDTIDVLSELMNDLHGGHEKRIKRIEKHLQLPQVE